MNPNQIYDHNLVIVSNRLPVVLQRTKDNGWAIQTGSGGLVTALAPVLRNRGGTWIGWTGVITEESMEWDQILKNKIT